MKKKPLIIVPSDAALSMKKQYKYYCDYCHEPIKGKVVYGKPRREGFEKFCSKQHANMYLW